MLSISQVKKLNIPTAPGSYQYYDKSGRIIYIGKAANLRARVFSYWRPNAGHTAAKKKMVSEIAKIEWIETGSEIEALLLESNLIKKYQPKYNVVLRDDKRFIYIKITDDEFPRVITTRNIIEPTSAAPTKTSPLPRRRFSKAGQPSPYKREEASGRYFGPFTSATAVKETLKIIRRIWPYGGFMTMAENKMSRLKSERYPELYGAPADRAEYLKIVKEVIAFLEGRRKDVEKNLQSSIINLQKKLGSMSFPRKRESSAKALNKASGSRVTVRNDNGNIEEEIKTFKYRLLQMRNVLAHSNILSLSDKYAADVVELAKVLGLPKIPQRIEGYDISNIFGREAVGSMVVFAGGEPDKSQYRKFKIKSSILNPRSSMTKGNDTGMLKEIIERRFNNDWPMPDLIIIDGGKGQLNAALSILKKAKLAIPIIAVSKGLGLRSAIAPDKLFFPGAKTPLVLPLASPALHIIKRVRDEAHRFAIGFHRYRRSKNFFNNH